MNLKQVERLHRVGLLEKEIEQLLNNDFEKLIQFLYRIDVSEEKVSKALANKELKPSENITQLVLERCDQILKTRARYKSDDLNAGNQ